MMVKLQPEAEEYEPTIAEINMARGVRFLVQQMLAGQLKGLAVCAVDMNGEETAFYLNGGSEDVLHGAIDRLRTIYATNRMFGRLDTSPKHNKSYRSH